MRRKGYEATVVGFYRDHGKTKPITKSVDKLKQRKIIANGHEFRDVGPRETLAQRLEDIIEDLAICENNIKILREQMRQLSEQGLETNMVVRQIKEQNERAALLKSKLMHLR
jgi:hypothetical protein